MKKYLIICLGILLFQACSNDMDELANIDNNEPEIVSFKVSVEEAKETALEFMKALKDNPQTRSTSFMDVNYEVADVDVLRMNNIVATRSTGEDEINEINVDTLVYAVNFAGNNGFALIAADKRTDPIIAIIDEGNFSFSDLNEDEEPAFLHFLDNAIGKAINDIQENNDIAATRATVAGWTINSIYPAKLKTKWGQREPYNLYCPTGTPTGCTVTATAQIVAHHRTVGRVSWNHNGANGSATLNWDRIFSDCAKNDGKLNLTSYGQSSREVAHLMRYLGVAFGATYKKDGTSVGNDKAIKWMNDWGGLNATKLKDYNESNIISALKAGKLVYGRGNSGKKKLLGIIRVKYTGGHAWVYDGYINATKGGKTQHLLHCNFGWNDTSKNGYYISNAFKANEKPEITDSQEKQITRSGTPYHYKYNLEYSIVTKK